MISYSYLSNFMPQKKHPHLITTLAHQVWLRPLFYWQISATVIFVDILQHFDGLDFKPDLEKHGLKNALINNILNTFCVIKDMFC